MEYFKTTIKKELIVYWTSFLVSSIFLLITLLVLSAFSIVYAKDFGIKFSKIHTYGSNIGYKWPCENHNTFTAFSKIKGEFNVTVFPNPSQGIFNVEVNFLSNSKEKVSLILMNTSGQLIYSKNIENSKSSISETLELSSSFPAGDYTLKVISGGYVKSKRISIY